MIKRAPSDLKITSHKLYKIKQGARSYKNGIEAETRARLYFEELGFSLLAQRHRTPLGEIDLLVANTLWLIAVEVKYRQKNADYYEALSQKQTTRLLNALEYTLLNHPQWRRENIRFDLIILNKENHLRHIQDAIRLY